MIYLHKITYIQVSDGRSGIIEIENTTIQICKNIIKFWREIGGQHDETRDIFVCPVAV